MERKIWPTSLLPAFLIAMVACWWHLGRALPAFGWGLLGALIGQLNVGAWFLTLALLLWTLMHDRRSIHWRGWLLGNAVAGLLALPWMVEILQQSGQAPLKLRLILLHHFGRWITQPFGLGIEYTLGAADMRGFLTSPWIAGWIAGQPTYLMGLVHGLLYLLILAVAVGVVLRARRTAWPSARDVFVGRDDEGVLLRAAFWGYCGFLSLLTLFGPGSHRHYLIVVAPLMALWAARLVFWSDWDWLGRRPRAILAALCLLQGAASAGLLCYIHDKQVISGEYGPTWQSQQVDPSQTR